MTPRKELKVVNLTKWFGSLHVLDGISFNMSADEILTIVGPTGCGKSTLLNIISRLLPPTSGDVYFGSEKIDVKKHKISYIFQEDSIFPFMNVRKNIEFGLKIRGVPPAERQKIVNEILKLLGLKEYESVYPKFLSAALRQLTILGRALAINPDILLMDEPYGNFDTVTRRYLEDLIIELKRKFGWPLIFVTHNIEEAVYVGDRVIVLSQKPAKIKREIKIDLSRPRNLADIRFIDTVNEIVQLIKWW